MGNDEQIRRLKQGVDEWNSWRHGKRVKPKLSGAKLRRLILDGANLRNADLREADLNHTELCEADLRKADLSGADLRNARLISADLREANLSGADLRGAQLNFAWLISADLRSAQLNEADLSSADLAYANLSHADMSNSTLFSADLSNANLTAANLERTVLMSATFIGSILVDANLAHAELAWTIFYSSLLSGARLTNATIFESVFADLELTNVIGLESCEHQGRSTIDHRTLQKSGPLPLSFLRGVGLPNALIEYLPSLLNQAIDHYSCFISYSTTDKDFADRLHADLQNKGVRCWFAPHDMPIGSKILDEIDAAIRLRDKVLLILSEHSIKSDWVEDEVTKAFEEEHKRGQTMLFPIRLDNAVMDTSEAWAAKLRARHIGDFRRWKDHDAYTKSFEQVLRDLTVQKKNDGKV